MERNKSDEYTFGVDEKETLDKLDVVEASVEKDLLEKGNGELVSTKYYSKFVVNVNGMDVELKDVFITAEKDDKGQMSYHFRWIKENENGGVTQGLDLKGGTVIVYKAPGGHDMIKRKAGVRGGR